MMKGQQTYMFHLLNGIRTYHWGSADAISRLLGQQCEASPQAELWLGAHPGNPSRLQATGQGLDELIGSDPVEFLGGPTSERFGQLPFLMKVLAAEQPLSIQVHPSLEQAREGFAREDAAGIEPDAAHRNYKDANHKPEMLYALGDFVALSGFRTPEQVRSDLALLRQELAGPAAGACDELLAALDNDADPLGTALRLVLTGGERSALLAGEVVVAIESNDRLARVPQLAEVAWAAGFYPSDPGLLVVLLMNVVTLQAGDAIALGAGNIHAYLRGIGIEVMANSDNVLRGGLTSKHIDVTELLAVTRTEPGLPQRLAARSLGEGNELFTPDFDEFQLQVLNSPVDAANGAQPLACPGAGIALCTSGGFTISRAGQEVAVHRGEALFLPAAEGYSATADPTQHSTLFVAGTRRPPLQAEFRHAS